MFSLCTSEIKRKFPKIQRKLDHMTFLDLRHQDQNFDDLEPGMDCRSPYKNC